MSGFVCPVCGGRLTDAGGAVRCPAGHSFDRAKEGYVNLLLVSRMHSKIPGDSKEMVAARNRFLNGGGYAPFAAELARLCAELARKKGGVLHILDAGCGEGYYDGAICAGWPGSTSARRRCGWQPNGSCRMRPSRWPAALPPRWKAAGRMWC